MKVSLKFNERRYRKSWNQDKICGIISLLEMPNVLNSDNNNLLKKSLNDFKFFCCLQTLSYKIIK